VAGPTKYPTGVRVRGDSVQINIPISGTRKYVTIPQPPTPKGISEAGKLRAYLKDAAKWGTLTQADVDAACNVKTNIIDDNRALFADYAQTYLDNISSDNTGTRRKYKGILTKHWMPFFAAVPIADINAAMVRSALNSISFNAPRTYNDALIPLRGVFDLAFLDGEIDDMPTKRIRNKKVQRDDPDPFLPAERAAILDWMKSNWTGKKEIWYLYYKWQFWTGCRPSETLAIDWHDVDWSHNTVKISKTLTGGKVSHATKTYHMRNIHINDVAKDVLLRLKHLTGHQGRVFISLHTDEAWTRDQKLSEKFADALSGTDMRVRPAYNCRHTYATTMLNSMIEPSAAAYQMGHDIQTFKTIYAKWINTERMSKEMMKLDYSD